MNVATLLHNTARTFPSLPAVTDGSGSQNYGELSHRVRTMAHSLREDLGLVAKDRVVLCIENCSEFIEVLFACWNAGLTVVPVNTRLNPREVRFIIEDSAARLCFASGEPCANLVTEMAEITDLKIIDVHSAMYKQLQAGEETLVTDVGAEEAAWVFYTSGTTGRPKGAVISHRALMFMSLAYFADIGYVEAGDTQLHVAPLSHAAGLYSLPHLAKGGHQVILTTPFDPSEVFSAIQNHSCVSMFLAPTMLSRLLNAPEAASADVSNIKTIIYGGGAMHLAELKRAINLFGPSFFQLYGQGEAPMTITGVSMAQHRDFENPNYENVLRSVGTPRTGVEVIIAGSDGRELPMGEVGEIAIRGDVLMSGYLGKSESPIHNGWLHTGDLGSLDSLGNLTLRGRSREVIISGGSNIYPLEVEEVLLQHEAVAASSVVGRQSAKWGEEVVAFVVLVEGKTIDVSDLDNLCIAQIARFKRPKQYFFRESLPTNNYGKVVKSELQKFLQEMDHDA